MKREEFQTKIYELWEKSRVPLTEQNLIAFVEGLSEKKMVAWLDELLDEGILDVNAASAALMYTVPGKARSENGPKTIEGYRKRRELLAEARRRLLAKRGITEKALEKAQKKSAKKAAKESPKEAQEAASSAKESSSSSEGGFWKRKKTSSESQALEVRDDENDKTERGGTDVVGILGKAAAVAGSAALVAIDKPLEVLDRPRSEEDKSLLLSGGLSIFGPVGWLYAGSFREAVPATLLQIGALWALPSFLVTPFVFLGGAVSSLMGLAYAWQYNRKNGRTPLFLRGRKKKPKKDKNEDE